MGVRSIGSRFRGSRNICQDRVDGFEAAVAETTIHGWESILMLLLMLMWEYDVWVSWSGGSSGRVSSMKVKGVGCRWRCHHVWCRRQGRSRRSRMVMLVVFSLHHSRVIPHGKINVCFKVAMTWSRISIMSDDGRLIDSHHDVVSIARDARPLSLVFRSFTNYSHKMTE